jgi:hypothetical protein
LRKKERLKSNEVKEYVGSFRVDLLKLKGKMKAEISRIYEHLQENENFGSFETSYCNNLVGKTIQEIGV